MTKSAIKGDGLLFEVKNLNTMHAFVESICFLRKFLIIWALLSSYASQIDLPNMLIELEIVKLIFTLLNELESSPLKLSKIIVS